VMTFIVPFACVVTAVGLVVARVARPWELRGGSLIDKLRIGEAVSSYDFWLSWHGVGPRRRRDLRGELRANLWEARQHVGVRQAIAAVGPLRRLASESVPEHRGPRWAFGAAAGLVAIEVFAMFQIFVSTVVVDAAQASQVDRVTVPISLVPGMRTVYESVPNGGFSFQTQFGPSALVVAVAVFVLVARPWLRFGRRATGVARQGS
jgi:hypothetical protein